jgi:NhaP-type Na+/H+ or K+/H+ antiporter
LTPKINKNTKHAQNEIKYIASISLFILLYAQLPRTLNLIFENILVSFE